MEIIQGIIIGIIYTTLYFIAKRQREETRRQVEEHFRARDAK